MNFILIFLTQLITFMNFNSDPIPKPIINTKPTQNDWISLFDGVSTKGWHTYGQKNAGNAWQAVNGQLNFDPAKKQADKNNGGDLVTDKSFGNFHLKLEWKISKNGNSGIMFFVQDEPQKYKNTWYTGPEMQILDPAVKSEIVHSPGSLYDLIAAKPNIVKPAGEWNLAEVIVQYPQITLKLNGEEVVKTIMDDENWSKLIQKSKFSGKETPDFAKKHSGHIVLQDHGNLVDFRNIFIKKLN